MPTPAPENQKVTQSATTGAASPSSPAGNTEYSAAAFQRLERSVILESPAISYHLSESNLYAHLLARSEERLGVDCGPVLLNTDIQRVLARKLVCTEVDQTRVPLDILRYVAHIYNSTLGTDFLVVTTTKKTYFLSDGSFRRRIEDIQEEGRNTEPVHARRWTETRLKSFLEKLADKYPGLEKHLLDVSPELQATAIPPNVTRSQTLYVKDIVIPTANRAEDLKQLLNSLAGNFAFYDYHPSTIHIRVIDTSTSDEQRAATQSVARAARRAGLEVDYVGPQEMREHLERVENVLEGHAKRSFRALFMRGLYAESEENSVPLTIGTIRNAISLIMGGEPYISLDDDMVLEAPIARYSEHRKIEQAANQATPGIDLHVGAAVDFMRSVPQSRANFQDIVQGLPTDIIGIANRVLDTPQYVVESRIVGSPTMSPFKTGDGRVSTVRPYIANASPDVTIYLRKFMQSKNQAELSGEAAPAHLPVHLPAACLYCGYSSGTMYATSNGLEAPFLDARAYEDVAQTHLMEFLYGNDLQFQGGAIEHRRAVGSRVMNGVQYIDVLLGFHVMTRYLSPSFPDSYLSHDLGRERDRTAAFRRLGRAMFQHGEHEFLSPSDLKEFTNAYLRMREALRAAKVSGAETFSSEPEQIRKEIESRYRLLLRTNGLLMHYWPDFARASDTAGVRALRG